MKDDKVLWSRPPWIVVQKPDGRIRVDHGVHSDWPVLYISKTLPWVVAWDRPEVVPKDVVRKVKSILIERELKTRK